MKNLIILMPVFIILSIFLLSEVYAQSSSNNTLKTCVDAYMQKFDQGVAKLDQNLTQQHKDKLNESENNSTFLKRISTDACVSSYKQTGKFGHLLPAEEQEKFVTASFFKLIMEEKVKNQMNK